MAKIESREGVLVQYDPGISVLELIPDHAAVSLYLKTNVLPIQVHLFSTEFLQAQGMKQWPLVLGVRRPFLFHDL